MRIANPGFGSALLGMSIVLHVHAKYDPDVDAWWAESDDVPGLVSEAKTFEALIARVADIAPELLALNRPGLGQVSLEFHTTRQLEAA